MTKLDGGAGGRAAQRGRTLLGVTIVIALMLAFPMLARAASPQPGSVGGVDPRSGPGASFTGDPLLAAISVVVLGVLTSGATIVAIRLSDSRSEKRGTR